MTVKTTTLYRAIVSASSPGKGRFAFLQGAYWTTKAKAELERLRLIRDREGIDKRGQAEVYEVQMVPAIQLPDGRYAVLVAVQG